MTRYCKQCGHAWTTYKFDPPEFCNVLCEERFRLHDRTKQQLAELHKFEAQDWTRQYLNSLTPTL